MALGAVSVAGEIGRPHVAVVGHVKAVGGYEHSGPKRGQQLPGVLVILDDRVDEIGVAAAVEAATAAGAEAIPAPAAGAGRRRLSVHLALQGRVGGRCSRAAAAAPCASSAGGARVDCLALRTPDFARTGEVQRHGLERHGHLHRG